ncbi:MAG: DegV family protein [Firmicutes bacterium]|nr:DegV family protein [Bacillota bacterium]
MSRIKIFSDSTCDLSPELIERHQIGIVPLYVNFEENSFKDGINLSTSELYTKVQKIGMLPTTAAPSPGDFIKAFAPHVENNAQILYIGISSELSATISNARLAAEQFPPGQVTVIDSRNLSTGIGLLVMRAVDFRDQGLEVAEIAEKIQELAPKVETEFIIDTLEYLHKGGRCSGITRLVGGMLKIRPSIKVVDGKMIPAQKFRGSRKKALNGLLETALAQKDEISPERIFVTHSLSEDGPLLKAELEKHTQAREVIVTQAGCVISSHCGPNTIGILFIKK